MHSHWASEHIVIRVLMKPQFQERTQNDSANFMEENSCHAVPAVPNQTASPRSLALGVTERGHGPKVHRMLEPEGNLEIPLLDLPLDSQENQA